MLKKTFNGWSAVHRREKKRKAYEKQLRRLELEQQVQKKKETKEGKKSKVEQNHELQSKLRGFLDGLKDKVENKDRLRTIKEHTE